VKRTSLVRPSTRAFIREARRTPGYSLFDWLHGYVYARWPYLYIGLATGEHRLSRLAAAVVGALSRVFPTLRGPAEPGQVTFADTYHGKVVPLDQARRLVTVERDIRVENLERVIPYARARDIVLQHPDHIVVLECPCRAGRPDPCLPLDVCLIVGEPMASFVAEHHPRRSRWIEAQEAVAILHAESERGHVHHAFFKDAMLGRFYAICNCCSCCCGAMQAHRNGVPMLASSGYVSAVDEEQCVGCGACAAFCQFEALAVHNGHIAVDTVRCMGCGACVSKCPHGALSLARAPERGEPLEIEVLLEQAIA
jgi:Pyruvate/2-oxoacid:ferredoxin oxidoreductase delta subunit